MITFIPLQESHLEQVMRWRTSQDVTQYMFTDMEYNLERQQKWFEKIQASDTDKYWVIAFGDRLAGLISLNQLDYLHRRTSWGYYIGEEDCRMYGALVPPHLYNYVFYELQLNKITVEVMEGNENVRKIHKMHGYREVGIYQKHVYKYGQYHDIYIMELLKNQWDLNADKYKKYKSSFAG